VTVDAPNGVGTTIVNGINDAGKLVGFYGTAPVNTGFVATPVRGAAANGNGIGPDAHGTQLSSGGVVEPPIVTPVAVEDEVSPVTRTVVPPSVIDPVANTREVSPVTRTVVPPSTIDPVALHRQVSPNSTGIVLDPPTHSPNAANGR